MILTLLACSSTPTSIDAPEALTWTSSARIDVGASVLDEGGEVMPDEVVVASSSSAPDVVQVGNGALICQRNGASSVTLTSGALERTVQIQCAIVSAITGPDLLRVVFEEGETGEKALRLQYAVEGPEGVEDLPVSITSSAPTILAAGDGGGLTALDFGAADVTIAVSDKTLVVPVEVARELPRHTGLVIGDGDGHGISLEAGRYLVKLHSDQPIEAKFQGTDCESDGEGTDLEFECTLAAASALRIENPGLLGMGGGKATVNARIVQLP